MQVTTQGREATSPGDVSTATASAEHSSAGDDLIIETKSLDVSGASPRMTLPSSTVSQTDSDLGPLEPSGEAGGSSSGVSSSTSSESALLVDDKQGIPLARSEEGDPAVWMKEWEKIEGETEVEVDTPPLSVTVSSVADGSENSFTYTHSPNTDPSPDSAANYQSDSSTDSKLLVSGEATRAAVVEVLLFSVTAAPPMCGVVWKVPHYILRIDPEW